jgi:hypothetical protein
MALVTLCLKLRVDCLPAPVDDRVARRVVGIVAVTSRGCREVVVGDVLRNGRGV